MRADASLQIGTGHVMRCLTLAEALRESGNEVSVISRDLPGNMIEQIEGRGIPVKRLPAPEGAPPTGSPAHAAWAGVAWEKDAGETRALLQEIRPDWLVVDHYAFDERWEKAVREDGMRVMAVDDLADRLHDCDLLLDQNLGRDAADYKLLVPDHCKLLTGPRYALLRPEFAARRSESLARRKDGQLEHILVSMGGIDKDNVTARVLKILEDFELPAECQLTVVMGHNSPWFDEVSTLAAKSCLPTKLLRGVESMATLMSEADLAIGGAGVSTWERCAMGLPTVLVTMAENQLLISREMVNEKAALNGGAGENPTFAIDFRSAIEEILQPGKLEELQKRAVQLCDGDGVARLMLEIVNGDMSFRDASLADSYRIWEWRQYPDRAKFNKSGDDPDFVEHHAWFTTALADPNRKFRIALIGLLPCGYLRVDRTSDEGAAISVCLAKDGRGKRLGKTLLEEGDRAARSMGVSTINAEIHYQNKASIRTFEAAGYGKTRYLGPFVQYVRNLKNSV